MKYYCDCIEIKKPNITSNLDKETGICFKTRQKSWLLTLMVDGEKKAWEFKTKNKAIKHKKEFIKENLEYYSVYKRNRKFKEVEIDVDGACVDCKHYAVLGNDDFLSKNKNGIVTVNTDESERNKIVGKQYLEQFGEIYL